MKDVVLALDWFVIHVCNLMQTNSVSPAPTRDLAIHWSEDGASLSACWRSEGGVVPPVRTVIADDTTTADAAYRLACEGTALLWRGDFHNARQLLLALARRIDRQATGKRDAGPSSLKDLFHRNRQQQARRAHLLGMLLIAFSVFRVLFSVKAKNLLHEGASCFN